MATHGRFFLGSNKVMQVALGRDETTEFRPQLQALGVRLAGFAGLLCTECVPRVVACVWWFRVVSVFNDVKEFEF